MGDFLKSIFAGGDQDDLNPKLRPPSLLGVLASLVTMFVVICCLISFRLGPVTLILSLGVVVFFGALFVGEGSAWERGYPSTTILAPIALGSGILPVYVGVKIFVIFYTPYYLAVSGRSYEDVSPSGKSAEFGDAGIIRFSEDATLDTSRAFGYKGDDFTYCVAPVVSRSEAIHPNSGGPKISFWAVGKDCCGNRRDFECDGAGETEVRAAFTEQEMEQDWLTKLLVPTTSRHQYVKAVEAAKALHNLRSESDDSVILVRWASNPEEILEVWHNRAKIAVALSCITYMVVIVILWTSIHIYFDRDIQKLAKGRGQKVSRPGPRQVRDPFMLGAGV